MTSRPCDLDTDEIVVTRPGTSMMWDCGYHQYTVSLVNTDEFLPRTIRLRLEVSKYFPQIL